MRRVILESPYAGSVEENVAYARAAVRDSLLRGESPIASHLLYTQPGILRDGVPDERQSFMSEARFRNQARPPASQTAQCPPAVRSFA